MPNRKPSTKQQHLPPKYPDTAPRCRFCRTTAKFLLPQKERLDDMPTWVLVCKGHAAGWFEGAGFRMNGFRLVYVGLVYIDADDKALSA